MANFVKHGTGKRRKAYVNKSVCINRQGIQLRHMKKNKPLGGNEAVPKLSSTQRCSWSV